MRSLLLTLVIWFVCTTAKAEWLDWTLTEFHPNRVVVAHTVTDDPTDLNFEDFVLGKDSGPLDASGFLYLYHVQMPANSTLSIDAFGATSWGYFSVGNSGMYTANESSFDVPSSISFDGSQLNVSFDRGGVKNIFGFTSPFSPGTGNISLSFNPHPITGSVTVPVPEPTTWVMLAGAVPVLWLLRKRLGLNKGEVS